MLQGLGAPGLWDRAPARPACRAFPALCPIPFTAPPQLSKAAVLRVSALCCIRHPSHPIPKGLALAHLRPAAGFPSLSRCCLGQGLLACALPPPCCGPLPPRHSRGQGVHPPQPGVVGVGREGWGDSELAPTWFGACADLGPHTRSLRSCFLSTNILLRGTWTPESSSQFWGFPGQVLPTRAFPQSSWTHRAISSEVGQHPGLLESGQPSVSG